MGSQQIWVRLVQGFSRFLDKKTTKPTDFGFIGFILFSSLKDKFSTFVAQHVHVYNFLAEKIN